MSMNDEVQFTNVWNYNKDTVTISLNIIDGNANDDIMIDFMYQLIIKGVECLFDKLCRW